MNRNHEKAPFRISLTSNEGVGCLERLGVEDGQAMAEPPNRGEQQQAEHVPAGQKTQLPANERGAGISEPGRSNEATRMGRARGV